MNSHMNLNIRTILVCCCLPLLLAGCGSKKATKSPVNNSPNPPSASGPSGISFRFTQALQNVKLTPVDRGEIDLPPSVTADQDHYHFNLWIDRGVPNLTVSRMRQKSESEFRQMALLRNVAVEGSFGGEVVWQPQMKPRSERPWLHRTTIDSAELPAESRDERLAQMKTIAARFSMPGAELASSPVYRFESKDYAVIDGGVFVFVNETVRAVLVIEAFEYVESRGWHYKLNRLTSPPGSISFDGKPVRSWEGYWANPRSPEDDYVEQKVAG